MQTIPSPRPAVKAKSDVSAAFIHYLYGMAYFIVSDSLLVAGENEAMQQYAQKTIRELDSISTGERLSDRLSYLYLGSNRRARPGCSGRAGSKLVERTGLRPIGSSGREIGIHATKPFLASLNSVNFYRA